MKLASYIADGKACFGLVTGEAILGANIFRDVFASIRDIVGGRSGAYENVLKDARETAVAEMSEAARQLGANAVIGVDVDYETIGGSMLMVSVEACAIHGDPVPRWMMAKTKAPAMARAR